MTDQTMYIVIAILAVVTVVLFIAVGRGPKESFSDKKRADIARKRAALTAKRRAEAEAVSKSSPE